MTEKILNNIETKKSVGEELKNQEISTITKILPGAAIYKNGGYYLVYNKQKLDMSFTNFESLKNATTSIAKIKRIYETEFGGKKEKPSFYTQGGYIYVNNKWGNDTKYMSTNLTQNFLTKEQIFNGNRGYELAKLVDFLNLTIANKTFEKPVFDDSGVKNREYFTSERAKRLTSNILKIYKEKHKGKKFYVTESDVTKGDPEVNNNALMVIKVKSKIGRDTTILTDDGFSQTFGGTYGRKDHKLMSLYAEYLNSLTDKIINKK